MNLTKKEKSIISDFSKNKIIRINNLKKNYSLKKVSKNFLNKCSINKYEYNFNWLNVPIIQYPQDIVAVQELIISTRPDLIIETGVAHGGSLLLSASILLLLDFESKNKIKRRIIGVDNDIRSHNKKIISNFKLKRKYITLVEGSSVDLSIFSRIKKISKKYKKIMVFLDSNHTFEHVYKELILYTQLVSKNSYCVVFDTGLHFWGKKRVPNRDFSRTNNPYQAVEKFIKNNKNFKIDHSISDKLQITSCEGGYLKKINDK
jgi:cephalosporin hydroxylase